MRVLVVGSARHLLYGARENGDDAADPAPQEKVDKIFAASREIGQELARRNHIVVVGSDDQEDVDPHVVEGALSEGSRNIEVHVPREFRQQYPDNEGVEVIWHQFPDWDVTTMEVIDKVDAVIAVGGRLGVVHAGTSAWMMRKTVIAVGSFGGGAETVGKYGSSRRSEFYHHGLTDQEIDRLASPWGGTGLNAVVVVKAMEDVHLASTLARVSAQLLYRVSGLMALALLLWVLGLVVPFMVSDWPDRWNIALLFPTVIAAGTVGAAVQTLRGIRGGQTNSGRVIVVDIMLGVAAGMIAAVLYLLAQIGISGTVDVEMTSADYARVSIIVSMASLFAALYLDSAFERFDNVGGSVISGKHKET